MRSRRAHSAITWWVVSSINLHHPLRLISRRMKWLRIFITLDAISQSMKAENWQKRKSFRKIYKEKFSARCEEQEDFMWFWKWKTERVSDETGNKLCLLSSTHSLDSSSHSQESLREIAKCSEAQAKKKLPKNVSRDGEEEVVWKSYSLVYRHCKRKLLNEASFIFDFQGPTNTPCSTFSAQFQYKSSFASVLGFIFHRLMVFFDFFFFLLVCKTSFLFLFVVNSIARHTKARK